MKETEGREEMLRHEVGLEQYQLEERHIVGDQGTFALGFEQKEAAEEALAAIIHEQNQLLLQSSEEEDSEGTLLPDVSTFAGLKEAAVVFAAASCDMKLTLAASIIGTPFLLHLQTAFQQAETTANTGVLAYLFTIYREMVHFCSPALTEILLSDTHYETLFGSLEYDPSEACKSLHFREFLRTVVFHNVLNLPTGRLLSLIHSNYRLLYLKDTALARCMEEPCLCFLTNLQLNYAAEIVLELSDNREIRLELITNLRNKDLEAFKLLGEVVAVLKQAQLDVKSCFLETVCKEGMMEIAICTLEGANSTIHSVISDLLLLIFTTLPVTIKDYCLNGHSEAKKRLISSIIDAFLASTEVSSLLDLSELLQFLLDPTPDRHFQDLLDLFYDFQACKLLSAMELVLIDSEETRIRTIEIVMLLVRCVQGHGYRIRTLLIESEAIKRLKGLMETGDKPVIMACIRLIREILSKNDPSLVQVMIRNEVFGSIWRLFQANGKQEGMLFSSVLSLITVLRSLSIPALTAHIADTVFPLLEGSELQHYFAFVVRNQEPGEENGGREEKRRGRGGPEAEKRRKLDQGW